ncbi:MAG: hypothetical protein KJ587_08975 [Alphaproteobacteria bacterium]|nr:hypothetical protein [Alphaproteobacteria bacterium]
MNTLFTVLAAAALFAATSAVQAGTAKDFFEKQQLYGENAPTDIFTEQQFYGENTPTDIFTEQQFYGENLDTRS